MKLQQLRTFIAVIEQSSISGAARQLALSPASVSAHIKALEAEFHIELFLRQHDGVQLTEAGRALEQYARGVLQAAEGFAAQAESFRKGVKGGLRLAMSIADELFDLPRFARELSQDFPEIRMQLSRAETPQILKSIACGDYDMGIVYGDISDPRFCKRRLGFAELALALPASWSDKHDGSWRSLEKLPWINTGDDCPFQEVSDALFSRHGINPPQYMRVDDNRTRFQLVRSGLGVSLLDREEALHPDLLLVDTEPLRCDISLVVMAHRQFVPAIKAATNLILGIATTA